MFSLKNIHFHEFFFLPNARAFFPRIFSVLKAPSLNNKLSFMQAVIVLKIALSAIKIKILLMLGRTT